MNSVYFMFPTAPTIAKFIGEYGFWFTVVVFFLCLISAKFEKKTDDEAPWFQQRE